MKLSHLGLMLLLTVFLLFLHSGTFLPPVSFVSPSRSVAFAQVDAGKDTQSASRALQIIFS